MHVTHITAIVAFALAGLAAYAASPPFPLSFQDPNPPNPASVKLYSAEGGSGIVFDNTYRVPAASWPNADLGPEQRAIEAIASAAKIKWGHRREVFGLAGDGGLLTGKPVASGTEPLPITILPSPINVVSSLAGVKRSPADGVFVEPRSIRPDTRGTSRGVTVFVPRTGGAWASDSLTPRMQGVAKASLPSIIPPGVRCVISIRGRVVDRRGVLTADHLGLYDDIIGSASTAMITRSIWYYRLNVANPHKGKRSGSRMGVLDDAATIEDWCFPIMDANGQARPEDDPRKAERSSPYENLVSTSLIEFVIKNQQAPVVLPTVYELPGDAMGDEHDAALAAYEGTETIVLPQRLIDAAGGVVIVRKAASWRPMAQDIVIDADTKNHAGMLGVYISQVVTDERLVDAVCELAGVAPPPAGAERAALVERIAKLRERP